MASSSFFGDGTEVIVAASQSQLRVQFEAIELRVVSGPDAPLEVSLGLPVLRLGTAPDNDVVLTDRAVSRRHAEIRMTSAGLLLRDLGSTNGTFINDVRITEAYIPADAECRLGYSRLLIRQHTEERKVAVPRQDHLGELVGSSERNCWSGVRVKVTASRGSLLMPYATSSWLRSLRRSESRWFLASALACTRSTKDRWAANCSKRSPTRR